MFSSFASIYGPNIDTRQSSDHLTTCRHQPDVMHQWTTNIYSSAPQGLQQKLKLVFVDLGSNKEQNILEDRLKTLTTFICKTFRLY